MNVLNHVVHQKLLDQGTVARGNGMLPFPRIEHKMVCLPVKDTVYFLCCV